MIGKLIPTDSDYSSTVTVTSTSSTTIPATAITASSNSEASLKDRGDSDSSSDMSTTGTTSSYEALQVVPIVSNTTDAPVTGMSSSSSSRTFAAPPNIPTPPTSCDAAASYTVKEGDTCFIIARAHGITAAEILQANPQMSGDCDLIYIDQVICLPTGFATSSGATDTTDSSSTQGTTTSTIASGQSLTTKTSTTGDGSTSTSTVDDACTLSHTVVPGDTCHNLWSKYSLTVDHFLALNPHLSIRPSGYCGIDVGDVVCVAGDPSRTKGPGGETPHPEGPSELLPHVLSTLEVIPVSIDEGQAVPHAPAATGTTDATGASRRLLGWLPVTFRTSTVRETGEE
ncbi:hypothetical protein PG993_004764 [Apiospora rasikravindrae]|uniref:LysM domain-containing protein n=1 Tax=Apiospora rasikravindrae TaxID=990691 RepID=A0ABR1TDN5_9PEZI